MSRDLFAESSSMRHAPRRSPWTIAGSVLAHLALLTVLLVLPILSALDDFVVRAENSMTFVMPSVTLPPSPPPPRAAAQPQQIPDVNVDAAPANAPDRITTPTSPAGNGPGVPGGAPDGKWTIGTGPVSTGAPPVLIAPPPPASVAPVRPGGNLKPPTRMAYVAPTYPPLAKATRVEGSVILEAIIDEAGLVRDIRVLRSNPLFDQSAIDAVRQWRYAPTRLNGVAVPVILSVTVMFAMK
ncbi:MAG TPA: TonB family protein [Vicinamibacterales bacterium]|nr:TonB family protein [Vicinamibacterales bacterium]